MFWYNVISNNPSYYFKMYISEKKNKNQKQYCNKFNKDFKNGPHQKKILKKKLFYPNIALLSY